MKSASHDNADFYRLILDAIPAHIAVLNRNGVIIVVNRSWERFGLENGLDPGDPLLGIGLNYLEACRETDTANDAIAAREGIKQVLNGCLSFFELDYPCHSPAQGRWFNMSVTPLGHDQPAVVVTHSNITERKRCEAAQRARDAQLHVFVQQAPVAIAMFDQHMNYLATSRRWANDFGQGHRNLVGLNHYDVFPDLPDWWKVVHRKGLAGETQSCDEDWWLHADGSTSWLNWSVSPWIDASGNIGGIMIQCENITERKHAEENLREFTAAAQLIREQEKSRMARELHDELGQSLTFLKMEIVWLKQMRSIESDIQNDKLEKMLSLLDGTVVAARRIASDLRPLILDDLGLGPAVEWLVTEFSARSSVQCELDLTTPHIELPEPYATTVFRVLQESLTNIAKHAKASRVEVSLGVEDALVVVTVRDDGRGFNTAELPRPNAYGLLGMRERVYLLSGAIKIDSAPSRGTLIEIHIPIAPAPELT